jgi:molybdopterin/thiamine biosynthesis adenylyltransferase
MDRFEYKYYSVPRVHITYDNVLQMDVFHWHGDTGKEKCEVVAKALNSLNHGKD